MFKLYRDFVAQDEIDAQYRVAHSPQELAEARARAQSQSNDARRWLRHSAGVRYGPTKPEYLDIFPAASTAAPVFVFFHGGYWRALASGDYSFVAIGPHALGLLTVSVNYALAPRVGVDEIVRQARSAVAWVMRNIERHGGDPGNIVVGGHSAGAQLAAMCLATDWRAEYGLDPAALRGGLLVSGLYELEPLRFSYLQPQIQLNEGSVARNSPARHVRPCASRLHVAVGDRESDEFRRQTLDYHAAWQAVGNIAALELVPNAGHFESVEVLQDPGCAMCRWLVSATH